MRKQKTATCVMRVPVVLAGGMPIEVGTTIQVVKEIFRNGEHHLVTASGAQVPSVFFAC